MSSAPGSRSTGRRGAAAGQPDADRMTLTTAEVEGLQPAVAAAVGNYLDAPRPPANVVGVGVGVKWRNGEPTGEPALVVLVTHKVEKEQLSEADLVPATLESMQTDVLTIGYPVAGGGEPAFVEPQTLKNRVRPAKGGYSVGDIRITAGTLGTCVYDILPGGSVSPPVHGVGIPSKFYILSNNHVLADSNLAPIGDPIVQPGPVDGGVNPVDRIATLTRFVPIHFLPSLTPNLVDAAVAEGQFSDLDREIYWIGHVAGWRRRQDVRVGMVVKKTGRTTNFTTGRITAINATVNVGYGAGRVARFTDQIVTTNMSAGGDSGSLVVTVDPRTCCNVAVGLLFAGSAAATIVNQIENVRALLRVEVAEQIL